MQRSAVLTLLLSVLLVVGPDTRAAQKPPAAQKSQVTPKSHVDVLQELGVLCLGDVASSLDAFRLDSDPNAPYLRPGLVTFWTEAEKQVFSDSASSGRKLPILSYRVESVDLRYDGIGSGMVERSASLSLRMTLEGPDGQILADRLCSKSWSDSLSVNAATALADPRYSVTDIVPENRGWFQRYLKPVVAVGAAAIGTYLLFNLRSSRSSDG